MRDGMITTRADVYAEEIPGTSDRRSKVVYDSQRRRNRINNSKDEFRTSKFNTMPQL
ncbi:uncharacterized protein LOC143143853 [Ptiloglossa arizonensis]|uniref:uncharacterized protein LOC143143853 n=1 Tax=Ptiloglossa arizonensis TaxID=3350558 RepID=UPI003FA09936